MSEVKRVEIDRWYGMCQICGSQDELRPYGANGEFICFDCGMADEETTSKQFEKYLAEQAERS